MPGGVCELWHVSKLFANVVYVSQGAGPTHPIAQPRHATPQVRTASLKEPGLLKKRVEDHLFEKGVQRQMQCVNAC